MDDQPLIMMNKSLNNSNVHLKRINKTVVNHTKNPVEQHVYTQCKRFEIWFNASAIIPQQSAWTCTWMFTYCSRLQRAHKHPHFPICSPSLNPLTVPWSCEDQLKPPQYARCAHFACRMSILVLNIQIQEHTHPHRTVSKFVTVSISPTVWWPWIRVWLPESQWRRWGQIWPCTRWSSGCTPWSEDTGPASLTHCCLLGSGRARSCSCQRPVGEMQTWNTAKTIAFSQHCPTCTRKHQVWACEHSVFHLVILITSYYYTYYLLDWWNLP